MNKYKTNAKQVAKEMMKIHGKVIKEQRLAMTAEMRALSKSVKQNLTSSGNVQTKALRKSIGHKVKVKQTKAIVYGVVGARRKVKVTTLRIGKRKVKLRAFQAGATRYFHLVESGHKVKGGSRTKGYRNLEKAFDRHVAGVVKAIKEATNRGMNK